jgi:hypothetical protein
MNKSSETKASADAATAKPRRNRQPAEAKLAELKRRLLEISDLMAAEALLDWDQSTHMPGGGANARARQSATLSRLAHEKSVDPALSKLLDDLAPHASGLPYDSDGASLIRIARRDFEKAIKLPSAYVARASELRAPRPTMRGRGQGRQMTLRAWCRSWRRPSSLAANMRAVSRPTSMSPTL